MFPSGVGGVALGQAEWINFSQPRFLGEQLCYHGNRDVRINNPDTTPEETKVRIMQSEFHNCSLFLLHPVNVTKINYSYTKRHKVIFYNFPQTCLLMLFFGRHTKSSKLLTYDQLQTGHVCFKGYVFCMYFNVFISSLTHI